MLAMATILALVPLGQPDLIDRTIKIVHLIQNVVLLRVDREVLEQEVEPDPVMEVIVNATVTSANLKSRPRKRKTKTKKASKMKSQKILMTMKFKLTTQQWLLVLPTLPVRLLPEVIHLGCRMSP